DGIENDLWQRDHEDEKRERKCDRPECLRAEVKEHQTAKNDDRRASHQEIFCADYAENQRRDARQKDEEAGPVGPWPEGAKLVAFQPDQVTAEDRNKKSVRIIRIFPPIRDHVSDDPPVQATENNREDEERYADAQIDLRRRPPSIPRIRGR